MDIQNHQKLDRNYVVKVIEQYNDIDVFEKDEIPTTGTVYEMCFAMVKSMNAVEEKEFVKLCEARKFEGDIEDLYEVLTEQKRVMEHMLAPPGKKIVRKPVRSVTPEEEFNEPEEEKPPTRRNRQPVEEKQEVTAGKDKYGFRMNSISHNVMKLAEKGRLTIKEIQDKTSCTNAYTIFKRVNETTDFVVETLNQKGKKTVFVNPKKE